MLRADTDGKKIVLRFPYSARTVQTAKTVPGYRWSPKITAWTYPLEIKTARLLKEAFGPQLKVSDELRAWSRRAAREERRLLNLVNASDANPRNIPRQLSKFLRPYQRADVAFMGMRSCINANQAGLGKTTEVIAATIQSEVTGPNLVIAPISSLEAVWALEIAKWCDAPVFTGTSLRDRRNTLWAAFEAIERGESPWVVVNPDLIEHGWTAGVEWGVVVIDEFHTMGLANPKSLFRQMVGPIQAQRKWALSGSPVAGKPLALWSVLNWIDPVTFSSRWRWAEQWLDKYQDDYGITFGDIKAGREEEFYRYHAPWMIRRLKSEVAPELPPKTYRDVWVKMSPAQSRQYKQFCDNAEIKLSGERMIATSKLAEYQRLKLFSFGSTVIENGAHMPTENSPKLDALIANINHHEGEQILVFSQFRRVVDVVYKHLSSKGFSVDIITGKTQDRAGAVKRFQTGKTRILVISTKAAGVSLTLDNADSVHILDQTWVPDDQEQAEDRAHRISRIHNVTVYYYRTRGTVEEYIHELNLEKVRISANVLDKHRQSILKKS